MNKARLKFCRATWANFHVFRATFLQVKAAYSLLFEWLVNSFENKSEIKQQQKSEHLSMYEINKLDLGEGTCTAFSHLMVCIRNLTRSISDTSPTHAKIPYACPRSNLYILSIGCFGLDPTQTACESAEFGYGLVTKWLGTKRLWVLNDNTWACVDMQFLFVCSTR